MPSPRRKGTGSGTPLATTTGLPSTTGSHATSVVTRPVLNAAEYTLDLVSDLLVRAGLDPPITTLLPQDHVSRMSARIPPNGDATLRTVSVSLRKSAGTLLERVFVTIKLLGHAIRSILTYPYVELHQASSRPEF